MTDAERPAPPRPPVPDSGPLTDGEIGLASTSLFQTLDCEDASAVGPDRVATDSIKAL